MPQLISGIRFWLSQISESGIEDHTLDWVAEQNTAEAAGGRHKPK